MRQPMNSVEERDGDRRELQRFMDFIKDQGGTPDKLDPEFKALKLNAYTEVRLWITGSLLYAKCSLANTPRG